MATTTSTAATELGIDLTDRELYRNGFPHERLSFLRDEPVWWHPLTPGVEQLRPTGFYVVARHDVVREVSRDPQRFTAYHGSSLGDVVPERRGESIVNSDPPVQSRFRRLVSLGFTPRMVARLDEMMEGWARRIVDSLEGRDHCEFVGEVAELLPLHVIADIVGIPVEERSAIFDDVKGMLRSWDPESGLDPAETHDAQMRLLIYAHTLSTMRRDAPEDDVWSQLVHAQLTLDDGTSTGLNEIELDLWFLILAIAGSETTRNAIAIGLKTLLEHPEEMERLRAHPEMIDTAVDEIIRWSSPVLYHRRSIAGRHRAAGRAVGRRPADHHVLARRQPRRAGVHRPVPVRPRPHPERPRGLRRGRPALLPRCEPRQARGEGDVRRAALAGRRHRPRHLGRRRGSALVGARHGRARRHRPRPPAAPLLDARLSRAIAAPARPARTPEADLHGFRRHLPPQPRRPSALRQICTDSVDICLRTRSGVGWRRPLLATYVCSSHTGRFGVTGLATSEWRNWQTR